jgi:YD repeat-containing protein
VTSDGSLLIADSANNRVRRVGPDGIISTLAGGGTATSSSGPATGAMLSVPLGVAIAPDGRAAIAETGSGRLHAVEAPLPGFSLGDLTIPSVDGREIFVFAPNGRHLRTLDALTGGTRYDFGYDPAGRLTTITDGDGNVTTIVRDPAGHPTAIVASGGQQTLLTVDSNGYLETITNPANETVTLTYDPDGLLEVLRTPRLHEYAFDYDALGRLERDDDPAGGFKALTRTGAPSDYTVELTTAEDRVTSYQVAELPAGGTERTNTFPTGLQSSVQRGTDGTRTTTLPSGMVTDRTDGPDWRFGMLAPVAAQRQTVTPAALTLTVTETREGETAPGDLLTVASETRTVTVNGLPFTRTYDGATRTLVETTPEGRTRTIELDPQGRVASTQVTGLAPVTFGRDATGLLRTITAGTGPSARVTLLDYDAKRRLETITDPLPRHHLRVRRRRSGDEPGVPGRGGRAVRLRRQRQRQQRHPAHPPGPHLRLHPRRSGGAVHPARARRPRGHDV